MDEQSICVRLHQKSKMIHGALLHPKRCKSFQNLRRNYPPETLVKFPESMKYDVVNKYSRSFSDVRIGCMICERSFTSTMDARQSRDYYSDFFRLEEIDLRYPYYTSNFETLKEVDECNKFKDVDEHGATKYDGYPYETDWFLWRNPDIDYVHKLRRMLHFISSTDASHCRHGVCHVADQDTDADQYKDYYGPDSDIPDPVPQWMHGSDYDLPFIDKNLIYLCRSCYIWSTFVHQDINHEEKFQKVSTRDLAEYDWLVDHEDDLICKTNKD